MKRRLTIPAMALVALLLALALAVGACGGSTTTTVSQTATTAGASTGDTVARTPELIAYAGDMLTWAQAFQTVGEQMKTATFENQETLTDADLAKLDSMVTALHESADQLGAIQAPESAAAAHEKVVASVDQLVIAMDHLSAAAKKNDIAAADAANKEITEASTAMQAAMTEWATLFGG